MLPIQLTRMVAGSTNRYEALLPTGMSTLMTVGTFWGKKVSLNDSLSSCEKSPSQLTLNSTSCQSQCSARSSLS